MAFRSHRSLLAVACSAVAAVTLTACGGGGGDAANGEKLFKTSCGSCHTMTHAGTTGNIGPNLDDAFRGPRAEGFKSSSFRGVVEQWIKSPEQKSEPIMPAEILVGQDARDVAEYVAIYAGTDEESAIRPAEPQPDWPTK